MPDDDRIFVWLTGQRDNIGDSALRRAYAHALRDRGAVLAWAGDTREGYVSGLGLRDDEIASSFRSWYVHLVRSAFRGRASFAFNAGEFVVTREYFFGLLAIAPWLMLVKLRGGRIIWLGAAVRNTLRGFTFPFTRLARTADLLRWRDTASSQILGVPAPSMPDWAFALPRQSLSRARRGYLAVCLRADRGAPADEWIDALEDLAHRLDLQLITVTQVKRDAPLARKMAERWNCDVVEWQTDAHDDQERVVRDVYGGSAAVVSDRLHALIIASTEGAVPIGWTTIASVKVGLHFDAVELSGVALGGPEAIDALNAFEPSDLAARSHETAETVERAIDGIRVVEADLQRVWPSAVDSGEKAVRAD